jgi:glycosyltransferase involved in cell wall biosynthesis
MKITHVVINYYPSVGGTQIFYQGISENCIQYFNDEVEVLTIDSYYGSHSKQYKKISPANEIINGVVIKRFSFFRKHIKLLSLLNILIYKISGKFSNKLWLICTGPWSPTLKKSMDNSTADIISASPSGFLYMQYPLYRHKLKNPKPFVYQGAIHFGEHEHSQVVSNSTLAAIKASEYYMANTEYEKKRLINLGVPEDIIVVTGVGVEMQTFEKGDNEICRNDFALQADDILIGYIGRLEKTKSIEVLINAFIKSLKQNKKLRLVIAGFESDYFKELQQFVQTLNAFEKSCIFFKTNLLKQDKVNLFHALDIFVLPSLNESFGIVFLEAWSCKKPVIGVSIGAVASVISDRVDGLLMKPNDANDLSEKLLELASNPELRKTFGINGFNKTVQNFTWPIVTQKYRDTYIKAINKFNNV